MKQKVLSLLKPLLASKGFNKEELEGLATIVAANLNEASTEEEINNAIGGVVPYADMMQKVANRMVSGVEAKYKGWVDPSKLEPKPAEPKPAEPTPVKQVEEKPLLTAEAIQKMISDGIEAGLRPYREKEEKQRLQTILNSHDKVKSIPESFRSRYSLEKEEDLEAVASQVELDFTSLKQELIKSGEFTAPPQGGSAVGDSDDLIQRLQEMGKGKTV